MLQAYALQQTLLVNGFDNEIINLRTARQKKLYGSDIPGKRTFWKRILVNLVSIFYRKALKKKNELFELFLTEELILTPEYNTEEALEGNLPGYDCYIAGSDQIWNTLCFDFDRSFFLPFVHDSPKISYAVSIGGATGIEGAYEEYLRSFDLISVREESTVRVIERITGKRPQVVMDPTILLTASQWRNKIKPAGDKKPYILLYSPWFKDADCGCAKKMSEKLGLPIVVTNPASRLIKYPGFRKELATGPWEFLQWVNDAQLVICHSFHAVVFSILFHIPFFAIEGNRDKRIFHLLALCSLQDRSLSYDELDEKGRTAFDVDFSYADKILSQERKKSIDFLLNALSNMKIKN
ncbi:hypothetical protein FACS189485_18040 [Spirochaetia bacterium]|nr:hypothetical protein FACS189485_18040 [Spirochaetia bacterium]